MEIPRTTIWDLTTYALPSPRGRSITEPCQALNLANPYLPCRAFTGHLRRKPLLGSEKRRFRVGLAWRVDWLHVAHVVSDLGQILARRKLGLQPSSLRGLAVLYCPSVDAPGHPTLRAKQGLAARAGNSGYWGRSAGHRKPTRRSGLVGPCQPLNLPDGTRPPHRRSDS